MTCAQVSLHQECRNDKNIGGFSNLPNISATPNKRTNDNKNRVHMHKTRIKNGSSGGIFSFWPSKFLLNSLNCSIKIKINFYFYFFYFMNKKLNFFAYQKEAKIWALLCYLNWIRKILNLLRVLNSHEAQKAFRLYRTLCKICN